MSPEEALGVAREEIKEWTRDLIQIVSKIIEDPRARMQFHKRLTARYLSNPPEFSKFEQGQSRAATDVRLTYWNSFIRLVEPGCSESVLFEAEMFRIIEDNEIVAVAPYDIIIEGKDGATRSSFLTVGVGEPDGVSLDKKLREYEQARAIEETDANTTEEKGLHYRWVSDIARLCANSKLFLTAQLNKKPLFPRKTSADGVPATKSGWAEHFAKRNQNKWWGSPKAGVQHSGTLFSLLGNETKVKAYRKRFDEAVGPMFEEAAKINYIIPRFDRSRTNGAIFQGVNHHYDFEKREVTILPFELATYLSAIGYSMEDVVLDRDEVVNGIAVYHQGEKIPFSEQIIVHFLREFDNAAKDSLTNGDKKLIDSPHELIKSQAANGAYCRIPTYICTIVDWMVPVMPESVLDNDLYAEVFSNIRKTEENMHIIGILWDNWAKYAARLPALYRGSIPSLEDAAHRAAEELIGLIPEMRADYYRALEQRYNLRPPEHAEQK